MRWSDFEGRQPRLAAVGREKLLGPGVVLVVTVRRDGTPRWRPSPGEFHLFAVDVDDVTFIRYVDASGDQYVTRWPHGGEFVRRGTSTTMLGAPEPHRELLID